MKKKELGLHNLPNGNGKYLNIKTLIKKKKKKKKKGKENYKPTSTQIMLKHSYNTHS